MTLLAHGAFAQDDTRPPGDVPGMGDPQSEEGALALRINRLEAALRRATGDIDPPADLHGSSDYRKTVAAAIVRRGLRAAADNARERQ